MMTWLVRLLDRVAAWWQARHEVFVRPSWLLDYERHAHRNGVDQSRIASWPIRK